MKKHFSQMTVEETTFLASKVKAVRSWGFTKHASERMFERRANANDVLAAIAEFEVIEANFDKGSKVLVRGKGLVNNKQVCAVVAPEQGRVVTVYFNAANDLHKTIRMDAYEANLNIFREWAKH